MKECCANCRSQFRLVKSDYSNGGCEHTDMDGYICMAFADERQAVWMVGLNAETALCEVFEPKEDTE